MFVVNKDMKDDQFTTFVLLFWWISFMNSTQLFTLMTADMIYNVGW